MMVKSPVRNGSLAVLQLAAVPRDDEASDVAILLCLLEWISGNHLWMLAPLDGGFGSYIGGSGRWFW